jgi:hypothetical protein
MPCRVGVAAEFAQAAVQVAARDAGLLGGFRDAAAAAHAAGSSK